MNQELLQKVLSCPRLPSLPAVALQVIELCRQDDINIRQIATSISNDPALSTKILKTVNSSYYGLSQPVSTITHALVILGLNSVKTLALGFSLVSNLKGAGGEIFDPTVLWRRSLYAAVGARSIAQKVGVVEHEEAFLGGLFQDLGVMAMAQTLGAQYAQTLAKCGNAHHELWKIEREQFQLDHAQVGEALAEKWKLPKILSAPIRFHEDPDRAPRDLGQMVHAVTLGGKAAEIFIQPDAAQSVQSYFEAAKKWFNLDEATGSDLLETIGQGTREMAKLFEINAGRVRDVSSIIAEAHEVLLELSLKTQHNASQLEAQNKQLQEKAIRDPLTGAANRGRFNEFLCQQFEFAQRQTKPISMVLLDADRFKSFNDTYGHLTGDKVLITLSQVLRDAAPKEALVARYGGEEFAVILPGFARPEAAQMAETFRKAVESTPVEADGQNLNITASFGVATFDGVNFFKRPEQLIKAADQAVYAAKGAGRNCVRVFVPRVAPPKPVAV